MKKIAIPKFNLKKIKKKWIIGGVIVLLVISVGSRFFLMRSRMNQVKTVSTKVNSTVTTGTIQTSVSGTGSISYADTTDIVVPSTLTVDELLVSEGSNVAAGDVIATVDAASLALCLNEVEEAIAEIDDIICSESSSSTSQSIKAGVAGRVKKIYADEDDSVVDIMKDKGALMLLSADDLMMVTIEDTTGLLVGDEVVVSSGDTTTEGTVESVNGSSVVITFDDSVFAYEEEVSVANSEGTIMGFGKAYIHQEISVVASSGIISSLNVSLNSNVSASTKVFTLTSSAKSAEYMQAVTEREQLVALLNTLVSIQVNGGITAPVDGMLQTVNTSSESSSSSSSQSGSNGFMMDASNETRTDEITNVAQVVSEKKNAEEVVEVLETNDVVIQSRVAENDTAQIVQLGTATKTSATAPFGLTGGAGFIYGTTVDMEYADKEDATEWKPCTADKTAVAAGIWYVRVKETDTAAASVAVKIEVTAGNVDKEQPASETKPDSSQETTETKKEEGTTTTENSGESISNKEENNTSSEKLASEDNNKEESNSDSNQSKTSSSNKTGGAVSMSGSSGGSSSSSTTTSTASSSLETTSMFTIANGDKMMVTMNVDELDIGTMQVGLEADITLDAIEGENFTGQIVSVSGNASSSGGSSQYPVEIVFDKTNAMLSGMNASVEVIIEQAENVLVIPLSAIQDDGNYSYVYTKYDEESDTLSGKVQVETGLSDETNVEITAGLSEGDTIYYEMQGSEDSSSSQNGMGGFSMPGGMGMPGGDFPSGGNMPDGNFGGGKQNGSNRGNRSGMGGQ